MRAYDLGSNYAVTVSAAEVDEWNRRWPCSTLMGRQRFEFEKKTGDLVDHAGRYDRENVAGEEATALSHDAQAYGKARLNLDH
jgi:hypothetical protein